MAVLPSADVVPHSTQPVALPPTRQETLNDVSVGFCITGGLRTRNDLKRSEGEPELWAELFNAGRAAAAAKLPRNVRRFMVSGRVKT